MYRLLEVGEVIESGDEWFDDSGVWESSRNVGEVLCSRWPMRRLVKPAVTPAAPSVPDPGEGYRLIDKAVDKPERGDEIYILGKWELRDREFICDPYCDGKSTFYRRKLPAKPAPVLAVGDRVKVLTGPWAGCTGVVVSWSVEITITGGEMKAKTDSQPVVRLDHVWVGGQRLGLTLASNDVEKLPPVVPEVLYRDLSHGETIRKGDEAWAFGHGPWVATEGVGEKCYGFKARHRRAVRVQSPGWRYLDAGETVQAGDEVSFGNGAWWGNCPQKAGKTVQDYTADCFRRKLPANQGG